MSNMEQTDSATMVHYEQMDLLRRSCRSYPIDFTTRTATGRPCSSFDDDYIELCAQDDCWKRIRASHRSVPHYLYGWQNHHCERQNCLRSYERAMENHCGKLSPHWEHRESKDDQWHQKRKLPWSSGISSRKSYSGGLGEKQNGWQTQKGWETLQKGWHFAHKP